MVEETTTKRIYSKDVKTLEDFMERKAIIHMRDAIRIAVEFTNAHGGFS